MKWNIETGTLGKNRECEECAKRTDGLTCPKCEEEEQTQAEWERDFFGG